MKVARKPTEKKTLDHQNRFREIRGFLRENIAANGTFASVTLAKRSRGVRSSTTQRQFTASQAPQTLAAAVKLTVHRLLGNYGTGILPIAPPGRMRSADLKQRRGYAREPACRYWSWTSIRAGASGPPWFRSLSSSDDCSRWPESTGGPRAGAT